MPTARGNQNVKPVIVEVKPSNVGGSNIAPSSPPGSPSKKARFLSTPVTDVSRPLSPVEAWSLYNFETHARKCSECYDPLEVYLKGGHMCGEGLGLAQDVAEHVYHHAGEVYSMQTENQKHVRVELQPGYDQVRSLLQAFDRRIRSQNRVTPIISYDRNYPVSARRRDPSPERRKSSRDERKNAIVEPAVSSKPHGRSSHKTGRYPKVVIDDDVKPEPSRQPERSPTRRRGSLYPEDLQKQKNNRGYVVEIREPEQRERERTRYRDESRRKEGRRDSGFWN